MDTSGTRQWSGRRILVVGGALLALGGLTAAGLAAVDGADPQVALTVRDASGNSLKQATMGQWLTFVAKAKAKAKDGGRLPFGVKICGGALKHARCSAPEYLSPLVTRVAEADHGQFVGRVLISGKVIAVRSIPVVGYPDARLLITDQHGKTVSSTRVGEVLRFQAVAPKRAALTRWMRVCLDTVTGNGDCAPPDAPYVLVRRVQPENVVKGRVTAHVVEFSRTWATKSIPVAG